MDVDKFILNVKALDPLDILLESAALGSQELVEANKANLLKGELSTGEKTSKYSADWYADYKESIGSISVPNMDLKLSGDFHGKFYSKINGSDVVFGSGDTKENMLQDKYGDKIFTVQQEQFSDVINKHAVTVINKKLSQ